MLQKVVTLWGERERISSAKRDHDLLALLHRDMTLTSDDLLVTQSVENPTRQD